MYYVLLLLCNVALGRLTVEDKMGAPSSFLEWQNVEISHTQAFDPTAAVSLNWAIASEIEPTAGSSSGRVGRAVDLQHEGRFCIPPPGTVLLRL